MKRWLPKDKMKNPAFLRSMLLGLLPLLLLASMASARPGGTFPLEKTSASVHYVQKVASDPQFDPGSSMSDEFYCLDALPVSPSWEMLSKDVARPPTYQLMRYCLPPPPINRAGSRSHQVGWGQFARRSCSDVWSALPPASAFSLRSPLRKYTETWPGPGATVSSDPPEINEDLMEGGLGDY
jgi:hypothetical protein